ncbi:MAG TPA: hypothetical protein VGA61_06020 [Anaerolineae bacterium]
MPISTDDRHRPGRLGAGRTENYPNDRVQTNVRQMLLIVVVGLVIVYYGTNALSAQDWIWFWRGFSEQPARIVLYREGRQTEWLPGRPGFAEVATGVVTALDQGTVRGSAMGLSEGSLEDAYKQYTTLEVFFDHPVKLHAFVNTGHPTQMLIPLSGRHAETQVVFLGKDGKYMSNGPLLKTLEPIRTALQALGYLTS